LSNISTPSLTSTETKAASAKVTRQVRRIAATVSLVRNGGAAQAKLLGKFFAGLDFVACKTFATESGTQCKSFGC
jgi:hypothetical protein